MHAPDEPRHAPEETESGATVGLESERDDERAAVETTGDSDAVPAPAAAEAERGEKVEEHPTEESPHGQDTRVALFEDDERQAAEGRWREIQTRFVDEPRASVEAANTLVAELVDHLVSGFNTERAQLEAQWDSGEEVTTEDLRVVLQRYRSFFGRLLEL
jgi:hypothetical protein